MEKKTTLDEKLMDECLRAGEINEDNLMTILRDNKDTEFGKKYGFETINSVLDYKKNIPLSDYSMVDGYVKKMMRGERNVLTVYPVNGYCHTSATTGAAKFIPVTDEQLFRYSDRFENYQTRIIEEHGGKRLLLGMFRLYADSGDTEPKIYSELAYRYMARKKLYDTNTYHGGEKLIFWPGECNVWYIRSWEAILYDDITILSSMFMYDMLLFFRYLEDNWKNIIDDIKGHIIPRDKKVPEHLREYLLSVRVDKKRLEAVEKEFEKGFSGIAGRLWKSVRLASGISSTAFEKEEKALERYIQGIPRYYFCYCASECYMGAPVYEDDYGYALIPGHGFFEFLPEGADDDETLLPGELEVGKRYEIICTNFGGLYRYRMGDIVGIKGFVGESPILEYSYRKNQVINIAGEKMDARQIETSMKSFEESGVIIEQYFFSADIDKIPAGYDIAIVLNEDSPIKDAGKIGKMVDIFLQKNNYDYRDLREMNSLSDPRVNILSRDEYKEYVRSRGLGKGQAKPVHVEPFASGS